jgi:hypothetical protein
MRRCNCGKLNCNNSHYDTFRFKIFNEGTKNTRKKVPTKAKKSKGSMTDIATKLGIKIKESFLTEDTLFEDKADKQRFIDKFGQDNFDAFWNNRQRLKNKGINADITWHAKHTSVSDMLKILDSISDEKIAAERDYEGNPLPEPTNNYEVVFKNDEYTVYHPMDYVSSIYCAKGGRWCTAGGYNIPDGQVKVSQAKQYFNQYTNQGVSLYYFIRNNGERYALAMYANSDNYEVYNKADENIGDVDQIPNIDDIEIEGIDLQWMKGRGASDECRNCGRRLTTDGIFWGPDNDTVYCEDCFDELCFWCYACGELFYIDDSLAMGPDSMPYCSECALEKFITCYYCDELVEQDSIYHTDEDEYICYECLDKAGYQICGYCGDAITGDDYEKMGDEIYCNSCFTRVTKPCCNCGALDIKYNMVRVNSSDLMCQDCAKLQMQQNESYSKPMRFKVRREL